MQQVKEPRHATVFTYVLHWYLMSRPAFLGYLVANSADRKLEVLFPNKRWFDMYTIPETTTDHWTRNHHDTGIGESFLFDFIIRSHLDRQSTLELAAVRPLLSLTHQ